VRALDPDREKRWPDVQSFTRELVGALDETTHDFVPQVLSIRETVVVATSPDSDLGENTALSDTNKPTIVKTPAPAEPAASTESPAGAEPAAARPVAAESAASQSAAAEPVAPDSVGAASVARPKRRRGRWVVAAVLALIVGGAGGFFGQRYLAERESVTVSQGGFTVDLPRGWAKSVAQSEWQPPGGSGSHPALRVSQNADWSSTGTPGIFVGLADAKLALPDSGQFGCSRDEDQPDGKNPDGESTTGRVSSGCGGADMVLLQRVVERGDAGSLLVQVMVPGTDLLRAVEMADSVKYSG
jgi:eukaryotic-like serine/threonine-protein kinase